MSPSGSFAPSPPCLATVSGAQAIPPSDQEQSSSAASSAVSSGSGSSGTATCSGLSDCDTLHFFGVYDGHGGIEAAQHCANRLHHHLSQALAAIGTLGAGSMHHSAMCISEASGGGGQGVQCQAEWTLCRHADDEYDSQGECSPQQQHEAASGPSGSPQEDAAALQLQPGTPPQQDGEGCGLSDEASNGSEGSAPSVTHLLEDALKDAFLKTDEEFATDGSASMVGSTAVVALVGTKKMWIANCGKCWGWGVGASFVVFECKGCCFVGQSRRSVGQGVDY